MFVVHVSDVSLLPPGIVTRKEYRYRAMSGSIERMLRVLCLLHVVAPNSWTNANAGTFPDLQKASIVMQFIATPPLLLTLREHPPAAPHRH